MTVPGSPRTRTRTSTLSLPHDHRLFLVLLLGRPLDLRGTPKRLRTVLALLACSSKSHQHPSRTQF